MTRRRSLLLLLTAAALSAGTAACSDAAPADDDAIEGDVMDFTSGPKLRFESYEVLFTNPVCQKRAYSGEVLSNAGARLANKPENVFCTSADSEPSGARDTSPQKRLVDWIRDPQTKEIFFAYLSFSNGLVARELCAAIKERNVKVTMVLDRETDVSRANEVLACKPGNNDPALAPRLELRGREGNIGFAHNKVFTINPHDAERVRIVFSSGNMSSGVVLHHENWHFLTVPASTHFAKAHLCLMDGMLDHHRSKSEYGTFIKQCRDGIGVGEEADLKTFFVPGDGGRAGQHIATGIRNATSLGIAAHRFSYKVVRKELEKRFAAPNPPDVRLVVDDDVWWAGKGEEVGPNTKDEFDNVSALEAVGLKVKYMETNHAAKYLHHNKFIVFSTPQGDAAFTGAGNFTGTAFSDNFENFYYITIPDVVAKMKAQHAHLYDDLATAKEDLPRTNVLP